MLAHQVSLEHEHQERLRVIQLDEIKVFDPDAERARRRDQADGVGGLRQGRGGDLQDVLHPGRHHAEKRIDLAAHPRRHVLLIHEEVDVVPVAEIRGDTPGRGVRLDQVADLAERRKFIADRGRRPCSEVHGERRGADRHTRAGVIGDDSFEDLLLALIERDLLLHVGPEGDGAATAYRRRLALVMVECQAYQLGRLGAHQPQGHQVEHRLTAGGRPHPVAVDSEEPEVLERSRLRHTARVRCGPPRAAGARA